MWCWQRRRWHESTFQHLPSASGSPDVTRDRRKGYCFPEVGTMGSAPKYELSSSFPVIVPIIWILSITVYLLFPESTFVVLDCPLLNQMGGKPKTRMEATRCEELTHWKRPWCWERLRAGGGGDRGWDGCMASLTQWTWVWANSGRWWRTGKAGVHGVTETQPRLSNWTRQEWR